jgi:hypothetical protein
MLAQIKAKKKTWSPINATGLLSIDSRPTESHLLSKNQQYKMLQPRMVNTFELYWQITP